MKRFLMFLAMCGLALLVYCSVWYLPIALYRLQIASIEKSCSKIQPGTKREDVFALAEQDGEPLQEAATENGIYFSRKGGCEVTIDPATGKVSKAELEKVVFTSQ